MVQRFLHRCFALHSHSRKSDKQDIPDTLSNHHQRCMHLSVRIVEPSPWASFPFPEAMPFPEPRSQGHLDKLVFVLPQNPAVPTPLLCLAMTKQDPLLVSGSDVHCANLEVVYIRPQHSRAPTWANELCFVPHSIMLKIACLVSIKMSRVKQCWKVQ